MTQRLFCFGLGYSALELATELVRDGWDVRGTVRTQQKADALSAKGIGALCFEGDQRREEIDEALSGCTHVLISAPPDEGGCPVFRAYGARIAGMPWIGYLSSTGVYGDHAGAWVHETSPTAPTSDLGENRLAAEGQWRSLQPAAHIFRLASIYGPGRSVLDRVRSGRGARIEHPALMSHVHVDDIVQAIRATIASPRPGEIFNIADSEPMTNLAFTDLAYDLLGMDKPPAIGLDHPMIPEITRKHFADSKRVDASKLRRLLHEALGVELKHPTAADGLRRCLEHPPESGV